MTEPVYALVKQAIDQADPIHLLAIGAPEDEYASEIHAIVTHLAACTTLDETQTLVHEVFVTQFDASLAGPKEEYRGLAHTIWTGLQALPQRQ
jgi:hypothetical protein